MKNNKAIMIGIVLVILIIGGIALAMNGGSDNKTTSSTATPSTSSSSNQTASNSEATAVMDVTIENYKFSPMSIKVKIGDTVTWTNNDSVHHSVIADTTSSDAPNGPLIGKGETYKFTFKKAGTYTYHCGPHPYMHGTVVVTE